jgi:predicted ABC-type ATPase
MFAGPNGSGKSTLKSLLPPVLQGVYLNPDEIEQEIRNQGFLDLNKYGVTTGEGEVLRFFKGSEFLASTGQAPAVGQLGFADGRLSFAGAAVNSYFASAAGDFLRQKLLEQRTTFTFETVMSHPSKVALLEQAQGLGYRTYLYYIATEDPDINVSRVRSRVQRGGHAVPEDKIASRYHRSLGLLMDAIRHTNRAYVFDNSGENRERTWIAEITDGRVLEMKTDQMPAWFKRTVMDKIK